MNIGEAVKALQIKYPSASISRIRFLEKEGLIKIKRSSGGTRKFTKKDIDKISKIIDLQENEFYSLTLRELFCIWILIFLSLIQLR